MPNHPAEIDPVILLAKLWHPYRPHSVVLDDFYHSPGLHWLMKMIGAIPMPNMWAGTGSYKRLRVERSLAEIIKCLDEGQNVLMYPSGRLMHSGRENLRAVSGVYEILTKVPDVNPVLVRTTGLIGSSFSWVAQQRRPNQWECVFNGLSHVLSNLIFFTPRRKVIVEFEQASLEIKSSKDKMELNRQLEAWYNLRGDESISLVSYSIWTKKFFDVASQRRRKSGKSETVEREIREKVLAELSQKADVDESDIKEDEELERHLGLDSLAIAELIGWLDEEFFVSDIDATDLHTVYDVMAAASGFITNSTPLETPKTNKRWADSGSARPLLPPTATTTVHLNFLQTCDTMKHHVAIADDTFGVLTYGQVKVKVLVMADIFREFPEERIGIMLPASVSVVAIVFAVLVAGKTPVMINWTLGDNNLRHSIKASGVSRILTSARFLDQLDQLNIETIEKYLVILEDVGKKNITLRRKLKGLYQARFNSEKLSRKFNLTSQTSDDIAVILFTSGSETVPKGVPLSHRNVLSNISGCIQAVELSPKDSIYAFLPPFHSFGFTVTMVLPLLVGIRGIFFPNPLGSRRIVSGISLWTPTIICGTPTFISGIVKAAGPEQLASLRLILVGAEKTPTELFERVESVCNAEILEGYGITECSPVLTINRPGENHVGVGKPIDGVDVCIVDVETKDVLQRGEQGLILVAGPNVFSGYLDRDAADAFIEVRGKRWYVTGDLGFITPEGQLVLSGRLKRFVKIGGEMISLPAMEATLQMAYKIDGSEPSIALSYREEEGKRPEIYGFTPMELTTASINKTLSEAGFGNLSRVKHVIRINEMPVLGSGKIDYRRLRSFLTENSIK